VFYLYYSEGLLFDAKRKCSTFITQRVYYSTLGDRLLYPYRIKGLLFDAKRQIILPLSSKEFNIQRRRVYYSTDVAPRVYYSMVKGRLFYGCSTKGLLFDGEG
jgi:hypothetical protein